MLVLNISGKIKSGKNNMGITRSGKHYPLPEWAKWRDKVVSDIRKQFSGEPLNFPCRIEIKYVAGDKRRRDVPGMMDALWHCFERAGLIEDDKFFTEVHWESLYDKENPGVRIQIGKI